MPDQEARSKLLDLSVRPVGVLVPHVQRRVVTVTAHRRVQTVQSLVCQAVWTESHPCEYLGFRRESVRDS